MKDVIKNNICKIIVIIASIVAIIGLFLPYEKSIGEYRENLLKNPETINVQGLDLKNSDVVDISIIENFKIYTYGMNNSDGNSWLQGESIINVVITIVLIVSIALILVFSILNKNKGVIIFDILLALSALAMNFDIVSRGVIPSSKYTYGISYYLYIVIAILILICTIIGIILKKKIKNSRGEESQLSNEETAKEAKQSNGTEIEHKENNIISKIFKSKKILISICSISIIILVVVFLAIFLNKQNDEDNESNNKYETSDKKDKDKNDDSNEDAQDKSDKNNSTNNSLNTKVELTNKENNIEYELIKATSGDYIIFGKNNNTGVNNIEIEVEFYNEQEELIDVSRAGIDAATKGLEFAVDLYNAPKSYDYYKVHFDLEKTDNKTYAKELKATTNNNGDEIVVQIKNTTKEEIEYIDFSIVYYKDNKVVGYDDHFGGSFKPGESSNYKFSFPYDENYNDLEFDSYKIFINEAYTYTW